MGKMTTTQFNLIQAQWFPFFPPFSYRDGVTHQSILSSLSASYNGIGELSYYEDLAKNIDANLAEVDMESFTFRGSTTTTTNTNCGGGGGGGVDRLANGCSEKEKERAMMVTRPSEIDLLDNSICKSKQLFSPVKENMLSVDSLDLDCYGDDGDIILTCQANKDNYTIAFEGSQVYSDESFYGEFGEFIILLHFRMEIIIFLCVFCRRCSRQIKTALYSH